MNNQGIEGNSSVAIGQMPLRLNDEPRVQPLTTGRESDVLNFLSRRATHTAYMAGLIHTNGLANPLNRGNFYAYCNRDNRIDGVALIGHAATFEAASVMAAQSFGRLASRHPDTVLIRGERNKIKPFWRPYAEVGRVVSRSCNELLLELSDASNLNGSEYDLRQATPAELEQAVSMNVELALAERVNDPLKADPEGFRQRLQRRIRNGQVWVCVRQGKVIFKAEIITRTPGVVYLEGICVHPNERGQGHGQRSMRQLGNILLRNAKYLCLFVNERNHAAQALYSKVGYQTVGLYETIYLREKSE